MAFHLGCLRALDRLGLLHRIDVLSTVSGGSVIGVFFHAHDGDFASFEAKMREVLSQGLAKRCTGTVQPAPASRMTAAFALIGAVAVVVALIRAIVGLLKLITPSSLARQFNPSTSGRPFTASRVEPVCSKRCWTSFFSAVLR